jgi:hypothetical protein
MKKTFVISLFVYSLLFPSTTVAENEIKVWAHYPEYIRDLFEGIHYSYELEAMETKAGNESRVKMIILARKAIFKELVNYVQPKDKDKENKKVYNAFIKNYLDDLGLD